MTDADATQKATALVIKLLETQPNLIAPRTPSADSGTDVAKFIVALRNGLLPLYSQSS